MNAAKAWGNIGEKIAEKYLVEKLNAVIMARNFTIKGGEIDIIADIGGTIAFVEVKLRNHGGSRGSIPLSKQKLLSRTALIYIQRHHLTERTSRFDVILVEPPESIEYIPRAFDFIL